MFSREPLDFIVVDGFGIFSHAIRDEFVGLARKIQRMPVRQVATMRQIHSQHGYAGLERGHINGNIRLRA